MPRYRFRFDAKGMELIPPQPAPAGVPAQGAERSIQPDDVAMLNELTEWLEEHSEFGLDMDLLEQREVLITPPHWTYVSTGVKRLLGQDVGDPTKVEDYRQAARKYATMLASQQPVLDRALYLVAIASQASWSNDPAQRMRDALAALPKGAKTDLREVNRLLPEAQQQVPVEVPPRLQNGKVREWAEAILARHQQLAQLSLVLDWTELEERAWGVWKERFARYRKGRRSFEVNFDDLLLRTRWAGPAALFRNELGKMPARQWSEALLTAARGNQEHSAAAIPEWVRGEAEQELFRGRKTLLIIVGESASSPSAQWLPSKQNGCLWIDRNRWLDYYETLNLGGGSVFPDAIDCFLAIELAGNPDSLRISLQRQPHEMTEVFGSPPSMPLSSLPQAPHLAYFGNDKLPSGVTPPIPYLENPKSVDEAVRKLEQLASAPHLA